MQATPPRSDANASSKTSSSPPEFQDSALSSSRSSSSPAKQAKSIEYLLVSRFNHMFAVTQELLLMFPREKAGAHRLVCDLQSEIDSLFQSIRSNTASQEEAAKLRDLQLQHAALGSSLASCVAEKIALEQLLQKEREEATASRSTMFAEFEASIRQDEESRRRAETEFAARDKAQLMQKLSACEESRVEAQSSSDRKLSAANEEISALKQSIERLQAIHEAECENMKEQISSQTKLIESTQFSDVQRSVREAAHHQMVASLMVARSEHFLRTGRRWALIHRARKMFQAAFGRWRSVLLLAKSLRKMVASQKYRADRSRLQSSFFTWVVRARACSRNDVSASSIALSRNNLSEISVSCASVTDLLSQNSELAAGLSTQAVLGSLSRMNWLAQTAQQSLAPRGRQRHALLPEITIDSDSDLDESQTLSRITAALRDVTTKLVVSQSDCDRLRQELMDRNTTQDKMLSQHGVLREQFQASMQDIIEKMNVFKLQVTAAADAALKAVEHVTADSSNEIAADAAITALGCFVSACSHDTTSELHSSNRLLECFSIVKMCLQKTRATAEKIPAELARAVEENKFISQRLHSLSQSLDGELELVSRSPSQPSVMHALSVIERTMAVLKHRHELAQEGAAASALQNQRTQQLLTEKNEGLEKRILELESASLFTGKLQQLESMQTDVIVPLQDNLKRLQLENSNLQVEVSARERGYQALQGEVLGYQQRIEALESEKQTLVTDVAGHMARIHDLESEKQTLLADIAGHKEQIGQFDAKVSECLAAVDALRLEALELPVVKAELEAAYASCQQHMSNNESQQQRITALVARVHSLTAKSVETEAKLTNDLRETIAANQQKLVSLAAHSEQQDERIAATERQMQEKVEELEHARSKIAALEADCANLVEANESFAKWKHETEVWSVQAIATLEAKGALVEGKVYCAFAAFASWGFCVRARDTSCGRAEQEHLQVGDGAACV